MNLRFIIIGFIGCLFLVSCHKDHDKIVPVLESQKTVFMYLPWASNLVSAFNQNISDMEKAVCLNNGLGNNRLIVFMSTSSTKASMYEIVYDGTSCQHIELKEYTNPAFTTEGGITSILKDVKNFAPAEIYSMIIGCHGMGWIPVNGTQTRGEEAVKLYWEYKNIPQTRYFGGTTKYFQTDISTLTEGIAGAGMKMEYILFDDCYMSSIEVAYELKDVTDYLIASTSEVMMYGMPYEVIGSSLLGETDYKSVCDGFYSFYSAYSLMPCGALAVTDCRELDELALIMKRINDKYMFDTSLLSELQRLDGYTPIIFYDYGDYVEHLCEDDILLTEYQDQMARVIPHKVCTECIYSMTRGKIVVNSYSGVTTSDPSTSTYTLDKTNTSWYKATH